MACKFCAKNREDGNKFCMACGEQVNKGNSSSFRCRTCMKSGEKGGYTKSKERYCPNCGEKRKAIFDISIDPYQGGARVFLEA